MFNFRSIFSIFPLTLGAGLAAALESAHESLTISARPLTGAGSRGIYTHHYSARRINSRMPTPPGKQPRAMARRVRQMERVKLKQATRDGAVVARQVHTLEAAGSSPAPATNSHEAAHAA